MILTPQQFVEKWRGTTLSERSSYQFHFGDVCEMVGYPRPDGTGMDARGNVLAFDYGGQKEAGGQSFADVFYDGHFAIEYKTAHKHNDLKAAYDQLLQYRERLNNPPLLVVCDIENWVIHTNSNNTPHIAYTFKQYEILEPSVKGWLRRIFEAPEKLHLHLKESAGYIISPPHNWRVDDLLDPRFQLINANVPPMDNLSDKVNRIVEMLHVIDGGLDRADEVALYFAFDARQRRYYRDAAASLGLITWTRSKYALTEIGMELLAVPPPDKRMVFAKILLNSSVFIELINRAKNHGYITSDDIEEIVSSRYRQGSSRHFARQAADRQQTYLAWLKWLSNELGYFKVRGSKFYLVKHSLGNWITVI